MAQLEDLLSVFGLRAPYGSAGVGEENNRV